MNRSDARLPGWQLGGFFCGKRREFNRAFLDRLGIEKRSLFEGRMFSALNTDDLYVARGRFDLDLIRRKGFAFRTDI